jgi:tetratricopeptide (TPR) repeat protein
LAAEEMDDQISARQRALKELWDAPQPHTVWVILGREAAARANDIAGELRLEAEALAAVNPEPAKRLRQIADEIDRVHDSIERFASVKSLAELVAVYRKYPICHHAVFNRLLGAFWLDAIRDGKTEVLGNLRRAMKLLSNVYVAVFLIQRSTQMGPKVWAETIEHSDILRDPNFHEFLDERARFAAAQRHESAEAFAQMASAIRYCCRVAAAMTHLRQRATDHADGEATVSFSIPVSPDQAEMWFLVSEQFATLSVTLAEKVNSSALSLADAIEQASTFRLPDHVLEISDKSDDEAARKVFFSSAFLEHLLRLSGPIVVCQALDAYRSLLRTATWNRDDKRGTFVLRCVKAFLSNWRYIPDPVSCLQGLTNEIETVLPLINEDTSPRLKRDLWFARARLLENVGIWQPEAYQIAAQAYERGLAVSRVKHELEARGMALTDYANTLSRIKTAAGANDQTIIGLYEEALKTFEMHAGKLGLILALNSYAIYLNERLEGERGANQERALALVQRAIDMLDATPEQELNRDDELVLRTIASAYVAKSNIIRRRELGDPLQSHLAALDALRTALDRLGTGHDDQLRGTIFFDLGHLNIELYSMTGELSRARDAMYAYQQAETLLQSFPRELSQALLGTAMLVSEVPELKSPDNIGESILTAEKALRLLEAANDPQAVARGWACLGQLHSLRRAEGSLETAMEDFRRAEAKFVESGNYENAIATARRHAALHIEQFETGGNIDSVQAAKNTLLTTIEWIEQIWNQVDSVDWRYAVSDRFSGVYADIAWCQAVLNEPITEVASSIARAKGREFLAHTDEVRRSARVGEYLGEYVDQLRVESRLAERERWRAARTVKPDLSVDEQIRTSKQQLEEIDLRRRLLFPPAKTDEAPLVETVRAFLEVHPSAVIFDVSVSQWGTVIFLAGGEAAGRFAGLKIETLPLKVSEVRGWVYEWRSAYIDYLSAYGPQREDARVRWAEQTDALMKELSTRLMEPSLGGLADPNGELVIAAGRLSGLPLHAVPWEGLSVMERVGGCTYVPNVAVLSPIKDHVEPAASALFVVSDLDADLAMAAKECEAAAQELRRTGTDVMLLAQVGNQSGMEGLRLGGVKSAEGIKVLPDPPTPARLSKLLPQVDHLFYSGHGVRRPEESGLVLVGDDGKVGMLSEDDILAMHALRRRPLIVLSACETAMGGEGSSEIFDVASCFLRVGARFVAGSLWLVVEDCAATFTAEFYARLAHSESPSFAFGAAVRALKQKRRDTSSTRLVPPDHPIYWAPFMAMRGE